MELLQSSAKPSIRNPLKKPFLLLQNNLRSRFQHGWIEVCLYKEYALSSPDGGKSAKKPRVQKGYHCSRNAYMLVYTQRTTEGRYAYQLNSLGPSEAIWQQRSGHWAWYLINNESFGGVGYIIKKFNHRLVFLMQLAINVYIDSASKDYFLHERPWISLWMSNELDITVHVIASQLSHDCDVIRNRLWRHQQNEDQASETLGWCVKIVVFIVIYGFVMSCKKYNNVCTLMTNCFCAHSSVIVVFI